jgi:Protein of unknown function (DUF4235)
MPGSKRIGWMLLSALSAALAGLVARKLVTVTWRATTGHEIPAEDDDRSISVAEAAAWAAGVGAAVGVARVLSRRGVAKAWEATTGEPPPGDEKKL